MKKKYMYLTLLLLIVLTIFVIIKPNKRQEVNVINEAKEQNSFAIYKDDGSGNYAISSDTSFPTKGYILNMDKTKCFDSNNSDVSNSIVSQSLDGKITLQATQASYCDLYFTKDDDVPVVTTFSITGTKENNETLNSGFTHKVNVTYNIGWNATDVVSYCISTSQSSCNGSWVNVSDTSVSPTEPALDNTEGKKTRYAFIKDKANNISVGKEASITLDLNNPTVSNVTYKSKDTSSITVNVTGSDGTTGSGVVKYECKATTQNTWVTQVGDTCTVTGLNDGTEYTIEGRVTDASGRVSTNSISTTQSTEAAYSCSAGEELVQDSQKGSSSGGYICKASASSKGWYNTNTYYTCSENSVHYSTKSAAESACGGAKRGICDSRGSQYVLLSDGEIVCSGTDRDSAKADCVSKGYTTGCGMNYANNKYACRLYLHGSSVRMMLPSSFETEQDCSRVCTFWLLNVSTYSCSLTSNTYDSQESCVTGCVKDGTVSSASQNDNYHCDSSSGWSTYSGSGSSLQCYRAATKG